METTEKLFAAVKSNDHEQLKLLLQTDGANVNAKNSKPVTLLHIAAWKGHLESVKVILENRGNPNAIGVGGTTPLHYAVKFDHLEIVKALFAHGAIYDVKTKKGKSPLDLCKDLGIKHLLMTIKVLFDSIEMERTKLINDLNKIQDMSIAKAVVNARNKDRHTLIQAAVISNCVDIAETVSLFRNDEIDNNHMEAKRLHDSKEYHKCIKCLNKNLELRVDMFGEFSPVCMVIEKQMCSVVVSQEHFAIALEIYNRICKIEMGTLGVNCLVTLRTSFDMGSVLFSLEKYQEALPIMKHACDSIGEFEGAHTNCEYARMQHSLGLVNLQLQDFEAASEAQQCAYKISKEINGPGHIETIFYLKHMCNSLYKLNNIDEAIEGFEEILKQEQAVLGIGHPDALATQFTVANLYCMQKNHVKAEVVLKELLQRQKKHLGIDHRDTLITQNHLAKTLKRNDKWSECKRVLDSCIEKMISVLGPNAYETLSSTALLNHLNLITD